MPLHYSGTQAIFTHDLWLSNHNWLPGTIPYWVFKAPRWCTTNRKRKHRTAAGEYASPEVWLRIAHEFLLWGFGLAVWSVLLLR